jgi:CRP-like cAMP-binding protein
VRLTLLLWHLAGRWGRVEPGGIRLALPLTHRLLGRLVGAERPSVSHALTRLAHSGLVTSRDGALHLHGTADAHHAVFAERPASRRDDDPSLAAGAALGA